MKIFYKIKQIRMGRKMDKLYKKYKPEIIYKDTSNVGFFGAGFYPEWGPVYSCYNSFKLGSFVYTRYYNDGKLTYSVHEDVKKK